MMIFSTFRRRIFNRSTLATALATLAAICTPPSGRTQAHLVVKIAAQGPSSSPQVAQLRALASQISGATSGTMECKLFPAGRLGPPEAILTKLEAGEVQLAVLSADELSKIVPAMALLSSPGAFPSPKATQRFFAHFGRGPLNQALAQRGMAFFTAGPSVYRPWFIRTTAMPPTAPAWQTINAAPVVPRPSLAERTEWPLRHNPIVESPLAKQPAFLLRATAVEARLRGFDLHATHIFRARDVLATHLVVFSRRWFDGLPAHLQEIVTRIGRQASVTAENEIARATEKQLLDRMATRGIAIIDAPKRPSRERAFDRRLQRVLADQAGHSGAALLNAIRRSTR